MAQIEQAAAHAGGPSAHRLRESIVERICRLACVAALIVMLVVVAVDIVTRSLFNFSFEISDELGGYMLVVITFVSLPVCQVSDSFHHVELVQSRLSPFGRALSHVDLRSAVVRVLRAAAVAARALEMSSFRFADRAPTYLATPLWIPQAAMALGAAAVCFTMLRTLAGRHCRACAHARRRSGRQVSPDVQIIVVFASFSCLLACGMAVPFAIAVPAMFYLLLQGGFTGLNSLGLVSWGSMNSFVLTCVPLFMLMAEILRVSGLSSRIYGGLAKLVARLPGGLLQTNIAGCAIFASVSGSSIATAASIGGVALPQLIRRNYDRRAGGGVARGRRHARHPAAAELRHDRLRHVHRDLGAEAVHGGRRARPDHDRGVHDLYRRPRPGGAGGGAARAGPALAARAARALADVLPFALLIAGTLGGIYAGLVTTTEGATIGCILAIMLGAVFGDLTPRGLLDAMYGTIRFSGNILFIIFTAYVFSYAISFAGVGEKVTAFIVGLNLTRLEFFLALFMLYTVLGCLIESLGMIVITVPLIFPVLPSYGIDPLLFGVVLVLFVELGQISPPIGINLFVIQSIWDGKLSEVILGTIPFHLAMFVVLALVILWPDLALWLPHHLSR